MRSGVMNIFNDEDVIIGNVPMDKEKQKMPLEHLSQVWDDFWDVASSIRKELGKKGFLLENYLSYIFSAINTVLTYEAGEEGFSSFTKTIKDFKNISNNKIFNIRNFPCSKKIEYIKKSSFREDSTKAGLCAIGSAHAILDGEYNTFLQKCLNSLDSTKIILADEVYKQMIDILGTEEQLLKLNDLFQQRFLFALPIPIFIQSATNDILYLFLERDEETKKCKFQLWLDIYDERKNEK